MKPTLEQENIVKEFPNVQMLKINACAGSGKSSTLKLLAQANPNKSLYVAFNKAIAEEAKESFPSNVECRTTHSLAFAKYGKMLMHKLNRPKGGYVNVAGTPAEIAKYYNMPHFYDGQWDVQEKTVASVVKEAVKLYEQSADTEIDRKHIPYRRVSEIANSREGFNKSLFVDTCLSYAVKLWKDRTDVHTNVLATHDTYLKLYQLSKPKLSYDIIYLDESQDTNPTVLDIVMNQTHAKVAFVGDSFQSIYAFRGAINAMDQIQCPTMYLTKSFRYGQPIADVATAIINGEMDIEGNETIDSVVGVVNLDNPYTMLFRTNGELLSQASRLISEGVEISCEIDTNDYRKLITSAVALFEGRYKDVKHDSIIPYQTWNDLLDNQKEEPELKRTANIVMNNPDEFISNLDSMKKQKDAHVTLTTAHKSKGRQWDQVMLADDFADVENGVIAEQERNLLYVAATRAVNVLQTNSTCDDLISGGGG